MKLPALFRRVLDRRRVIKPVAEERRRKQTFADADKRLKDAVSDFEQTISIKREDFFKRVANDRQQVVIFSTMRYDCPSKGPDIGVLKLCRHKNHPEAANSAFAICDENKCPRLTEALSAA